MNLLKPYWGRLFFCFLGLMIAILFLTIGFFRTMLILLLSGSGFWVGMYMDKVIQLPESIASWLNQL